MHFSAVIAAAGLSSRMRDFKPMVCLNGSTIIGRVISTLKAAGVGEIVVVTGYRSDILRKHVEPMGVRVCENADFAVTTMFDSVVMGLRALTEPCGGVFITPGDVPLVSAETLRLMCESGGRLVRPLHGVRTGHPVLLAAQLIPAILDYSGEGGLRGAMAAIGEPFLDLPVDDCGVLMDLDTPEDLRALRQQELENLGGGRLWTGVQVSIGRGDAVLTPETAQFLEMIGHTGSVRNACACMHISYENGRRLLDALGRGLGFLLTERFPDGTDGESSTLTPRGARLLEAYRSYRLRLEAQAERLFSEIFDDGLRL